MRENSYVYFELTGANLDPQVITDQLGILPTESFQKGDPGKYNPNMPFGSWRLSVYSENQELVVERFVDELVDMLRSKIEIINKLKKQLDLDSKLQIVLFIDISEENPTPVLGHNLKSIDFLHLTKTTTDLDIYRFDSKSESEN